jgi:hypothetical protein
MYIGGRVKGKASIYFFSALSRYATAGRQMFPNRRFVQSISG